MPIDAPDFTTWVQTIELVGTTPTPTTPSTETLLSKLAKVTTSSTDYQTLISYTVPAATIAILGGIEFYADPTSKGRFRLTVGGVEKWADQEIPTALNHYFADARLAAATVVLLEGKSSDGTSVDLWGSIEGKEVA